MQDNNNDKWNIYVVICDSDIPYQLTKLLWRPYLTSTLLELQI